MIADMKREMNQELKKENPNAKTKYDVRGTFYRINGLILRLIKFKQNVRISDPLGAGIFSSGINETITEIPKDLIKIGLSMTENLLTMLNDKSIWGKNIKKRTAALNHILYVYSGGKRGINSKKSIKKA